jgi:hypothetical protein
MASVSVIVFGRWASRRSVPRPAHRGKIHTSSGSLAQIPHQCLDQVIIFEALASHKPAPSHKIYPYLLRDMTIERPNEVWAAEIT